MRNKYTLFVAFITLNFAAVAQEIAITGNQYHLYGPNATWGQYLQVGGNGQATGHAFVATTNGNLHLDSKAGFATYINYYNQGNTYLNVQAGNVGVGTTAPATKFEVMQPISGWTMNSRVNAVTAGEINGFKLYSGYIGEDKWAGISSVAESQHSNKTGLALYSGMTERMRISGDGNVGIGITNPAEKLSVNGNIRSKEVKVEATNWPDYVFEEDYNVGTLKGLESYIKANKHLPEMPTTKEVEANGFALGEMNKLLLKKVEELTLHLIEKDHQINNQQKKMDTMEKDLQEIKFFMKNKSNEKN